MEIKWLFACWEDIIWTSVHKFNIANFNYDFYLEHPISPILNKHIFNVENIKIVIFWIKSWSFGINEYID